MMREVTFRERDPRARGNGWPSHEVALFGASFIALVALWSVTHLTVIGQQVDGEPSSMVVRWHLAVESEAEVLRMVLPVLSVLIALAVSVPRMGKGQWKLLADAFLVPLIASSLAELLKVLLVRPDLSTAGYAGNSFPSSNTAAVAALWVAVWLIVPVARQRWAAAFGILITAVAMLASVTTYAHRWSDVLGSIFLVAAVTAIIRSRALKTPRMPEPVH